ncbi:amidohydrolase [Alicyclobacillus mengziensis]|uniref:Amidohydrolase n=1 Tax=Alicyclobacillus mengziensis TaxID=2931921 RepID=A0A9X7Z5N5_9BACL|nr:amidohydrolase [Alicyclobacillus mengziensis]QSO47074.1 amidohydrolase [Alicyclobacillus mengziensis]
MSVNLADLDVLVNEVTEQVVSWRRHLHSHPELSFEEVSTSQYVYDTLTSFGGLEVSRPTKTSVVARLIGPTDGPKLAIRADMDALPIEEETDFEFRSQTKGVMHACGHDAHTAMLLGAAKILTGLRDKVRGEIRFIFQHAEELHPGGAVQMVEAGVMDDIDDIIGLHVRSTMESGRLCVSAGPINAASDRFDITIRGRGGHAAHPHGAVDSVAVAAQVIAALQHIVARNKDPLDALVISITKIHGGTAYNVIPETVELGGTVRSYNPTLRESVPDLMERVIRGITEAHGATFKFDYRRGYSPVINDEQLSSRVREVLEQTFGEGSVHPSKPGMGGEDFSGYLTKAPGTFFHLGAGNAAMGTLYPHHHPKFWLDEDAFKVGVKAFVTLALNL